MNFRYATSLPVIIAILALGLSTILFSVPTWYSLIGSIIIFICYRILRSPNARPKLRTSKAKELSIWPNTDTKAVTAAIQHPSFIVDRDGIVRFRNHAAEIAFPSAGPGDPLRFRIRARALTEGFESARDSGNPVNIEFQQRLPNENSYSASIVPIDNKGLQQRSSFFLVMLEDQTEQINLERMRSDFVANASHELRTPLASLSGFIETLQGAAKNDPEARWRFLALMQEQALRMSRLIDDLLSLSRIEMRAHVLPDGEADLSEIIGHITDILSPMALDGGAKIVVNIDDSLPPVAGDRDELLEVVENLLENAIKYGTGGEKIVISASLIDEDPQMVKVSVKDFGPGIAQDHIPRLTERFYRAPSNVRNQQKSTGLGLAIVKHIITRHRGRLLIESELGKGSVFSFLIPVKVYENSPSDQIEALS